LIGCHHEVVLADIQEGRIASRWKTPASFGVISIGGGPGLYFSKGNDGKFGVNAYLSAQYARTGPLSLECGADWHVVFKGKAACDPGGSGDAAFGAVRVGLILNFLRLSY